MSDLQAIAEGITRATGQLFKLDGHRAVAGGCINEALVLQGSGRRFFLKLNSSLHLDMFEAEAAGLAAMYQSQAIRVPQPIALGIAGDRAWLALEYIALTSPGPACQAAMGEQLAALHRVSSPEFGWERDNTIGSTPQPNSRALDWVLFFRDQRLLWQLKLAREKGADRSLVAAAERLASQLHRFFDNYRPVPSLLHGDLWGGNWAADASAQPVIFDPAVYFGDREADLAMTELFGGFDARFYQSYRQAWPLDSGYATRKVLYNLYHILNHYNLFGGGYAGQARRMMDSLLAELG